MLTAAEELRQILRRIDGRGYKAYKDISGSFNLGNGSSLHIDRVQGDPFASPSKVRVRVQQSSAKFPEDLYSTKVRKTALEEYLARAVNAAISQIVRGRRGSGKSGLLAVDVGAQEVLKRTAVRVTSEWVEARLSLGLPASGRRVLGRQAADMLLSEIPEIAEAALICANLPEEGIWEFVECIENQEFIRGELDGRGLVAFVADDSILPRESGVSDRPLGRSSAVLFSSPEALRVEFELPNKRRSSAEDLSRCVSGMGISKGVTLIVGGGYHGKSTLLRALERGVYPHIPGDGREYVVTNPSAFKIRAEDGRRIEAVDISPFISNLPRGKSTEAFSSDDASGSTSQAANIIEALEAGAEVLLIDEDTSATNFMIRDVRMQSLVNKEYEPITPFVDRVREIYEELGVSTVLVVGGSGDYFDVADTVVMMREYVPIDVTTEAKEVAASHETGREREAFSVISKSRERVPLNNGFDASRGGREVKIDAKAIDLIFYGREPIELRAIEQLVDQSQTRAIGYAIYLASSKFVDGKLTLGDVLDKVGEFLADDGLERLDPFSRKERHPGDLAMPRKLEVAAAINRLRSLKMRQGR